MGSKKRSTPKKPSLNSTVVEPADPIPPTPAIRMTGIKRIPKRLNYFTQCWIWYEGSFAISMLETWEKIVLHIFITLLFSMISYAALRYLPTHVAFIIARARFYLFGPE